MYDVVVLILTNDSNATPTIKSVPAVTFQATFFLEILRHHDDNYANNQQPTTKTFDNVTNIAENCCCCFIVCFTILFSQHYIYIEITKNAPRTNERNDTEHCLASCYIFVWVTNQNANVCTLHECCVLDCFHFLFLSSIFFLLRLFSSSLRPTFWCHFRVTIVPTTDRTIDIDRFSTCAPKIAKMHYTHTHTHTLTCMYSEFLGIICHFFPFRHFLSAIQSE